MGCTFTPGGRRTSVGVGRGNGRKRGGGRLWEKQRFTEGGGMGKKATFGNKKKKEEGTPSIEHEVWGFLSLSASGGRNVGANDRKGKEKRKTQEREADPLASESKKKGRNLGISEIGKKILGGKENCGNSSANRVTKVVSKTRKNQRREKTRIWKKWRRGMHYPYSGAPKLKLRDEKQQPHKERYEKVVGDELNPTYHFLKSWMNEKEKHRR